ncbi:MAG: alpha/beta fold hydrolase, partial [Nitrosotalea sp.]
MQEKNIIVNGNKIRYIEEGDSKNTIILLHGLGGTAERWLPVVPFLSKKYRVIALDLIGYGQSDKPRVDYTPEFFRDSVLGFLETLSLQKAFMVGTSLGGEIVAECAATQNPLIKKIVMVAPAGIMKSHTPVLDAYTMAALYPNHESVKIAYQMMMGENKEISPQS